VPPGTDLIVVLPGIMGSTLAKDGRLVWAPSAGSVLRAIGTFARSVTGLQLPDGIGDRHPDDGVEPVALMPDLHLLPGLWTPLKGYTPLVDRLTKIGFRTVRTDPAAPVGNLLCVPYDWRLSNRYNARRLATLVEPALDRWRAQGGPYAEAQVSFVCHSMGGLVARAYVAHHGGAEVTRKIVTLGTPYRGAARALDQLVNGIRKGIGPLALDLTAFARSLPSCYQLLPSYACVERDGSLQTLSDSGDIPDLDTQRLADSARFYADLEAAEEAPSTEQLRHLIVGTRQTTATTARITAGSVVLADTYLGDDLAGDGTVPSVAGPRGLPLDHPTLHHVADKHGDLQRNRAALDEVEAILLAKPIIPMGPMITDPRVDVPELIRHGEPLPVTVTLETRDAVRVTVTDESGRLVASRTPRRSADGPMTTAFTDLAPGGYVVDVTGVAAGAGIAPVSSATLVWSDAAMAGSTLSP
jgi:pimeloyl-ACP methyl ester carboxylesterase